MVGLSYSGRGLDDKPSRVGAEFDFDIRVHDHCSPMDVTDTAPSPRRACRHGTLAASGACRVERCEQGTVHLAFGGLTIRLETSDFLDLCATLQVASARLAPARPLH
jgi:hypothetical protein